MLDMILPVIAGILMVLLFIRAIDKRLKAMVTLVDDSIKHIIDKIDDNFIDLYSEHADLDALACNRNCGKRRTPHEYQNEKLLMIGHERLIKQKAEDARVIEEAKKAAESSTLSPTTNY